MRWPLRFQFLTPMVVILLITIGSVSVLNAWLSATRVRGEVESQLRGVAQTLEEANFPLESNVLEQTSALCGAELLIVNAQGETVSGSFGGTVAEKNRIEPTDWRSLRLRDRFEFKGERYFFTNVRLDRRAVGSEVTDLYIFYPEREWLEATRQAALGPLLIGIAAVVLMSTAAWWVAASVASPIQRLQNQVQKIADRDYRALTLPGRDDEVRDLAAAVNQLAERLAKYEEEVRGNERLRTLANLGSGIAHQVRNAATGCRIAIDLHQRDCAVNGRSDERLVVAKRQLTLIETHVQRLLALGKPAEDVREKLELAALLEDTLDLVRPTATHLGVELKVEGTPPNAAADGDGEALQQMLVNLLINAIQAAAADVEAVKRRTAEVRLRATLDGNSITIAIGDTGSGVPDSVAGKLFQPFTSNKPGGTGLGLSVARQTALAHSGDIRWRREGELTWFLVELPNWHGWHSDR